MLLTATCPPSLSASLLETLAIQNCYVIRAPTDQPEISYNVKVSRTIAQAQELLVDAVRERLGSSDENFRCLVYCRAKDTVEKIAGLIGCKPFHLGIPEAERGSSFQEWVQGKPHVMVSTSLLGCGIDVDGVQVVYHFLTPWSVMDFVQESGRAGRGGKPAESYVFASEREREQVEPEDRFGKKIMRDWVLQNSICRRIALSSFLDNRVTTCILLRNANLCDVCKRKMGELHPRRSIELTPLPLSSTDLPTVGPLPPIPPSSAQYAREMFKRPDTQE